MHFDEIRWEEGKESREGRGRREKKGKGNAWVYFSIGQGGVGHRGGKGKGGTIGKEGGRVGE